MGKSFNMSVPYLLNSATGHIPASERIPVIARPWVSERAKKTLDLVEKFVEEECIPADAVFKQQIGQGTVARFDSHPQVIEDLKAKAKKLGLWNMFLPKNHFKDGAEEQKKQWLGQLLDGQIRSAFLMTEPQVASSDATNIELNMRKDGDYWVLNGQKWWSSGA